MKPPFETAQPPSAPTPKPAASWIAYEASLQAQLATPGGAIHLDDYGQELLVQANVFRSKAQLTPYKWDDDLATCAKAHALDMARRNYFGHATPEGFTHLERVALLCRDFCGKTAENLAWRSSQAPVRAADFEALWEASPGHRRNLLRETFTAAGYAVVRVDDTYFAAGVYAEPSVRLARALPLWIAEGPQLRSALEDASPAIQKVTLTSPFQQPTWMAATSAKMPALHQGAWQLRPLAPAGDGGFSALPGPTFFVS